MFGAWSPGFVARASAPCVGAVAASVVTRRVVSYARRLGWLWASQIRNPHRRRETIDVGAWDQFPTPQAHRVFLLNRPRTTLQHPAPRLCAGRREFKHFLSAPPPAPSHLGHYTTPRPHPRCMSLLAHRLPRLPHWMQLPRSVRLKDQILQSLLFGRHRLCSL